MEYKVFGCKTNKYFAEKWLVHPHLSDKSGYFIASCVVTDKAKAKWVKHAKKKLPELQGNEKLYLSGCGNIRDGIVDPRFFEVYSELADFREQIEILPEDPDEWGEFGVPSPGRQGERVKGERIIQEPGLLRSSPGLKDKIRSLKKIAGKELYTRKYMVIQTGCDNFCTFCLTVQARGRHKWRPMEEILEEINTFVEGGGQEVVFTGINLGAWGSISSNDYKDSRLIELIEAVLERTTLGRLRISSLGVEFLSDRLIALFAQPRINAYVHLSIQSGSTRILGAMNRHYDAINVREVLQKLRNIKREDHTLLNIGADLIVGFPSETAEDFADTEQLVREYEITQLHAFPFSGHLDHYSVPAGSYPDQIPNHIAQSRLKHLLETGRQVFETFTRKNIGKKVRVLVEKVGKNAISSGSLIQDYPIAINQPTTFSGWSKNYLFCNETNIELFPDQEIARGKIVEGLYLHPIHAKIDGE